MLDAILQDKFPELYISADSRGNWSWSFRCTESEGTFDSEIEALVDFACVTQSILDNVMEGDS